MSKPLTALIFGDSYSGKTDVINAFANEEMNSSNKQPVFVKPFVIETTDTNFQAIRKQYGDVSSLDETQSEIYAFRNRTRLVRFIDTPTRYLEGGLDVNALMKTLLAVEDVNGVCFVINSQQKGLSVEFKEAVKCLFTEKLRSLAHRVFFIFTDTSDDQFSCGRLHKELETFLEDISLNENVNISFKDDNIFCIDCDFYRYQLLADVVGTEDTHLFQKSKRSLQDSCKRLFNTLNRDSIRVEDIVRFDDSVTASHPGLVATNVRTHVHCTV